MEEEPNFIYKTNCYICRCWFIYYNTTKEYHIFEDYLICNNCLEMSYEDKKFKIEEKILCEI